MFKERVREPIPLEFPPIAGWKEVPIVENSEPLVPLGPYSENRDIYTDSIYSGERESSPYRDDPVEGSMLTVFVRKGVAEQLRGIQSSLPRGMYLGVFDGYRTIKTQETLFERFINRLKIIQPEWTDGPLIAHTTGFVSEPSYDPTKPSTHNTGGSVDVVFFDVPFSAEERIEEIDDQLLLGGTSLKDKNVFETERAMLLSRYGRQIPFQTAFDHGSELAAINSLARKDIVTMEERVELYSVTRMYELMTKGGFLPLETEWWHWNSRLTQMGAKFLGLSHAEYGPARLSEENIKHEEMRREYYASTPGWEKTSLPLAEIILP